MIGIFLYILHRHIETTVVHLLIFQFWVVVGFSDRQFVLIVANRTSWNIFLQNQIMNQRISRKYYNKRKGFINQKQSSEHTFSLDDATESSSSKAGRRCAGCLLVPSGDDNEDAVEEAAARSSIVRAFCWNEVVSKVDARPVVVVVVVVARVITTVVVEGLVRRRTERSEVGDTHKR